MKYFIAEWKNFNWEMEHASSGLSLLCGLNQMFCDMVIKKAIKILSAPTPDALNITLDQLCGMVDGKFFYMSDIVESKDPVNNIRVYFIKLSKTGDRDLPIWFTISVPKNSFDEFLTKMMSYIDPSLVKLQNDLLETTEPTTDWLTWCGKRCRFSDDKVNWIEDIFDTIDRTDHEPEIPKYKTKTGAMFKYCELI